MCQTPLLFEGSKEEVKKNLRLLAHVYVSCFEDYVDRFKIVEARVEKAGVERYIHQHVKFFTMPQFLRSRSFVRLGRCSRGSFVSRLFSLFVIGIWMHPCKRKTKRKGSIY